MGVNMEGRVIIITAPSGAGKSTLIAYLMKRLPLLDFSVSATTRPQRKHESHGKDYYFLSPEEFKKLIEQNALIEWEEVYPDKFYGTLKEEVERIWKQGKAVIFDLDVLGALSLKKYFGNRALAIFIKPPSIEELERRLRKRGTENEDTLRERLNRAQMELEKESAFDKVVVNDDLERAGKELVELVKNFLDFNDLQSS